MNRFALAIIVGGPLAGCGALLGSDEDPTPPPADARADGGDGGDASRSADVLAADGGSSAEAGVESDGRACGASSMACADETECCSGLVCIADGPNPKPGSPMRCCADMGGPCTSPADCCLPEAQLNIDCQQMKCVVLVQ